MAPTLQLFGMIDKAPDISDPLQFVPCSARLRIGTDPHSVI